MKHVTRILAISLPILLTGCYHLHKPDVIQNREGAYLNAKSIAPLRIPPDLSSSSFDNHYPVSNREYTLSEMGVNVQPPGLYK